VDVLIDDAPDTLHLSCFNPLRRELARLTLDKLVEDGRIHPARIEETFERVRRDFDEHLLQIGKDAAFGLGIHDLKDRVLSLLGRLKFRHSDGQNILAHTLEVADISGHMARILELNAAAVRRAALYHELGLVEESDEGLTPPKLAVEIAKRSGETPLVVALVESFIDSTPANTPEAHLLRAAERLSFARPGALREGLENHLSRLENLEAIARQFDGVTRAYALKSGKELVVMLDNARLSDQQAHMLCEDLAARIHQEVRVDRGGLRIAVIRESRAIDYAT
jgi:ribonuclease Y